MIALSISAQEKIVPEEFVVRPGVVRTFSIHSPSLPIRVLCSFRAAGGSRNDISVIIAEIDDCENYVNGNQARTFYHSGRVTIGKIDVSLAPGEYCIAFDNRMSLVSSKEIAARVDLYQ